MKVMMNGTIVLKDNFSDNEKCGQVINTLMKAFPGAQLNLSKYNLVTLEWSGHGFDKDASMASLNEIKDAFLFIHLEFVSSDLSSKWFVRMEDGALYTVDCYLEPIPDTKKVYQP